MVQKSESGSLPIPQAEGQKNGGGPDGEPQISSAPREDASSPVVQESSKADVGAGREKRAAELAAKAKAEAKLRRVNRLLDRTVSALVQFLLMKGRKQQPFSSDEMQQFVGGGLEILFCEIVAKASMKLRFDFGFELKTLDCKSHTYIVVDRSRAVEEEEVEEEEEEEDQDEAAEGSELGLLMVILGLIYTKGKSVREAQVWDLLRRLGVWPSKYYRHFGYPRSLVTEDFVQQQFLNYTQVPHTSPPEYEFSWGPRSNQEISKMRVLSFMAKLQKKELHHWPMQYQEALADEANRARARARQEAYLRAVARYSAQS